jgi:hypothetical protein
MIYKSLRSFVAFVKYCFLVIRMRKAERSELMRRIQDILAYKSGVSGSHSE